MRKYGVHARSKRAWGHTEVEMRGPNPRGARGARCHVHRATHGCTQRAPDNRCDTPSTHARPGNGLYANVGAHILMRTSALTLTMFAALFCQEGCGLDSRL